MSMLYISIVLRLVRGFIFDPHNKIFHYFVLSLIELLQAKINFLNAQLQLNFFFILTKMIIKDQQIHEEGL